MEGAANVTTTPGPAVILSNLHVALESLGDALAVPALDPLVQAESRLASAVEQLGHLPATPPESPTARRPARGGPARPGGPRALPAPGESLEFVVRAGLAAQGRETALRQARQ